MKKCEKCPYYYAEIGWCMYDKDNGFIPCKLWTRIKKWFSRHIDYHVVGKTVYDAVNHRYICVDYKKKYYFKFK